MIHKYIVDFEYVLAVDLNLEIKHEKLCEYNMQYVIKIMK